MIVTKWISRSFREELNLLWVVVGLVVSSGYIAL
jgi:hypothetical protein